MKYHLAQTKIFLSNFLRDFADFFDAVSFHSKRALHLVRNSEKTKIAGYHIKRASKQVLSKNLENAWNWNNRLASSESFRIFDEDI